MPTNILQGNTAQFVIEYVSSAGVTVTPSSGALTITYSLNSVATSTSISLTLQNGFFTGSWDTTGVDLGIANWTVTSPLSANPAATGQINVIDP